jgi:iron complex outermembrane receptor protein
VRRTTIKYYLPLAATALGLATLNATAEQAALEEIIVTAEFRNISLQSQPASSSVVTADAIEQRAAQHLEDILNLAPNVNFASGASRARFYQVRGIGERSQYQEPLNSSIGFVIDGIDFSGLGGAGTLFDVQQVEILRGPQGTLHGANALAGLINVRTAEPTAEPYLRMEATMAEYNTWSAGIVGSGPLIADELLYRIAVNTYQSDGFIDNDFLNRDDTNNRDETSIRGKLRWLAGDTSSLDINALYVDIDNGYDAFSLDNTRSTLSDQPGMDRQESSALALKWHSSLQKLDVEASISWAASETDYGYDEDWSFVGIAPELEYSSTDRYLRDRDSYSAELRFLSNDSSQIFGDSTDWVAGIYYLADREDLERRYTYLNNTFQSTYDTETMAAFGQLNSKLSERLSLITGLRVENRSTDYQDNNRVDTDLDKTLWGGKVVLEYQLDNTNMLYGSVSRGYKAYGINAQILASMNATDDPKAIEQLASVQEFDDEHLLNYEVGYKASFVDNRVRSRLALFYMDREDQQVSGSFRVIRDDGSTSFIDYINNTAEGYNYGLELELEWLALENLNLYANLGLLETEFDNYVTAGGEDLSGREQAHAPNYQYAVGGRLDMGAGFYLRADLEGKDNYYVSDSHNVEAPSFNLLHMRLGYTTNNWSLSLWGRNLTDEDYVVKGFSFGNDPRKGYANESYFQYGEPRIVGVSASYTF